MSQLSCEVVGVAKDGEVDYAALKQGVDVVACLVRSKARAMKDGEASLSVIQFSGNSAKNGCWV